MEDPTTEGPDETCSPTGTDQSLTFVMPLSTKVQVNVSTTYLRNPALWDAGGTFFLILDTAPLTSASLELQ
jgi:hypothetical protein